MATVSDKTDESIKPLTLPMANASKSAGTNKRARTQYEERRNKVRDWTRQKVGDGADSGFWIGRAVGFVFGAVLGGLGLLAGGDGAEAGWYLGSYVGELVGAVFGLMIGAAVGLFKGTLKKHAYEAKLEEQDIAKDRQALLMQQKRQVNSQQETDAITSMLLPRITQAPAQALSVNNTPVGGISPSVIDIDRPANGVGKTLA